MTRVLEHFGRKYLLSLDIQQAVPESQRFRHSALPKTAPGRERRFPRTSVKSGRPANRIEYVACLSSMGRAHDRRYANLVSNRVRRPNRGRATLAASL